MAVSRAKLGQFRSFVCSADTAAVAVVFQNAVPLIYGSCLLCCLQRKVLH